MTVPEGENSTGSTPASSSPENKKKSARATSSTAKTTRKAVTESAKSAGGTSGVRTKKKRGMGTAEKVMWLGSLALLVACIALYFVLQNLKEANKGKGKVEKIVLEPEKDIKNAMMEGERNFRAAYEEINFDEKKAKLRDARKFFESASNKIDEVRSQERYSGKLYEYLENDYQMKAESRLREIREMLHVLEQQELKKHRTEEKPETPDTPIAPKIENKSEEDLDSRGPAEE